MGFPGDLCGKEYACIGGDLHLIPGSGRSLEKGMATHSSILAWRIPWTEEPGGLRSMALQRVQHDSMKHRNISLITKDVSVPAVMILSMNLLIHHNESQSM